MKRILISVEVPNLLPWNRFSAVACVIKSFAETLYNKGYEVYINEYDFDTVLKNSEISNLGIQASVKLPLWYGFFPKRMREAVKDILLVGQLAKQLKRVEKIPKPDYIISWVSYFSANGYYLAKTWNVPLISIYDNPLIEEYKFQFGFSPFFKFKVDRMERVMLKHSKKVIVYSEAMSFHLQKKYHFPIDFEYKQFIDTSKINYLDSHRKLEPLQLIFIGSFFKWHRIEVLVRVFEKLYAKDNKIKLLLVGDGPEKLVIEKMVNSLVCKNNIVFTGLMDKNGLHELLQESQIGVIPYALWFHAPVKLFQYAAAGLAIVAYQTPTIDFIIKGYESCFDLFKSDNQLLEHIEKIMIKGENRRLHMANQSQKFVNDKYNNDSYLTFFENLFKDIETHNSIK